MKYHFIIVTDLHLWCKNFTNRKDYLAECADVFGKVKKLTEEMRLKYQQDKIHIIFLGDVFHKGFGDNATMHNMWIQAFTLLRSRCNGMYLVMGNHEWSFRETNPFWCLVNEINSEYLNSKNAVADGNLPIAFLQDHLDIGCNRLHFLHHGAEVTNIGYGNNFMFAHQSWMTDSMFASLASEDTTIRKKYLHYTKIDENSKLKFFNEAFFGHMHRLQGKMKITWDNEVYGTTTSYHLGSLLLTNKEEVLTTGNKRTIPILTINDYDTEYETKDIEIEIPAGIELLKEEVVKEQNKKYKQNKEKKEFIKCELGEIEIDSEDPIEKIEKELVMAEKLDELSMFKSLEVEGGIPEWLQGLI